MNINFEENLRHCKPNLHKNDTLFKLFPKDILKLNNIIFYGPNGSGKYSQVLKFLMNYSNSNLKYEKKLLLVFNKQEFFYKLSDIHIEVDMAILGCNSKLLWNELYYHILDIINAKSDKKLIIVCKNFHEIHSELLDVFYSYMQDLKSIQNTQITLRYILITNEISFITDNIINLCDVIPIPKPKKQQLHRCFGKNMVLTDPIENLKYIKSNNIVSNNIVSNNIVPYKIICDNIINYVITLEDFKFSRLREILYNIFIYNLNIYDCVYYILITLIERGHITTNIDDLLIKTYIFFQYYNNNYRPIYHLENYIFNIISVIHGLQPSNPNIKS